MKQRRFALALALFLCAAALLSGTLLVLHAEHGCRAASCSVCAGLSRNDESFLCLMTAFAGAGLMIALSKHCLCALAENRYVPDWTLVRRKVKLQD